MNSWRLFVLLMCLSWNARAQLSGADSTEMQLKVKSIQQILNREKKKLHDTIVMDYYLQLAEIMATEYDYRAAISYCDSILITQPKLDFVKRKNVEEQKATYLQESGKTDEAMKILLRVLGEFEDRKNYKESAGLNQRIGIIFLKMDDFTNAEYHLRESIEYARRTGNVETEGYAMMSLGNRFKGENRFDEAEKYYNGSIEIAKKHNIQRLLAGNYNNFGSLLRMKKDLNGAMKYFQMAIDINLATGNDKWLSYNYNNMGNVYKAKLNYTEALRYFFLSTEIKDKLGDLRGKVQTLFNISEVYEVLGNYKEAYTYQRLHSELADSVAKMDNLNATKRLAAEFQSDKREAKIVQLNMQGKLSRQALAARDEKIRYQNTIAWVLGIGIFMILIIALLLWRTTISRKQINQELRNKNEQIDFQHNEIISSINYAKRIQNSILPESDRMEEVLKNYALLFRPKDIISGDFYVCDEVHGYRFFGTVDCTGHGVPGAMVSIVASTHFNKALNEYCLSNPAEILTRLNDEIPEALHSSKDTINDGMDMALCAYDPISMHMNFAGAYQDCWIVNRTELMVDRLSVVKGVEYFSIGAYTLLEIKGDRQGIGKSTSKYAFSHHQIQMKEGDIVVLASDGYQDQFGGPNDKKFKVRELRNLILKESDGTPHSIINSLDFSLNNWMGKNEQIDDICVLVVQF